MPPDNRPPAVSQMPQLRRSALDRTTTPSHSKSIVLKSETARTAVSRSQLPLMSRVLPFDPFAAFILHARDAAFVPVNQAPRADDERGARTRDFFVHRRIGETPRRVDLSIGARDGALIFEAHARGDLFIAQALREELGDLLLIRFEQCHRRAFVLDAHFVDARFDFRVNKTTSHYGIPQER